MATVSEQPPQPVSGRRLRYLRLRVSEMWASLAISVMWLVVLVDALFGPDFVSSSAGSFTRVPSAIVVAFFAYLGTRVVARYGFGDARRDADDA